MWMFFFSRWLCNTSIDARTRKWAVEGLAYLTFDADVKDDFVEDDLALQAMFELAKVYLLTLFPHSSGSIKFSQLSSPMLSPQAGGAVTPTPHLYFIKTSVLPVPQRYLKAVIILLFSQG